LHARWKEYTVINYFASNIFPRGADMLCSLATKLGEKDLKSIQALEKELGKTLLAFSCHPVNPAEISKEQLATIQKVENQLGVSLVAVNR
jgi:hypothetical protein